MFTFKLHSHCGSLAVGQVNIVGLYLNGSVLPSGYNGVSADGQVNIVGLYLNASVLPSGYNGVSADGRRKNI
jgi:hypothetical protein